MYIDINCDMGESFGIWKLGLDEEIIKYISSANVAGGFHAGDPHTMNTTVALAKKSGVAIGIHCGFRDLVGFGRRPIQLSAEEVKNDFIYQLGALREFGKLYGLKIQHVKPHGALYMMAAESEEISRAIIEAIQSVDPGLLLYSMEHSITYQLAHELNQPVVAEFFADREYDANGKIVFTRKVEEKPNSKEIAQKVLRAITENKVKTVEGVDIPIKAETICLHSDTPGVLEIAKEMSQTLKDKGIIISSFRDRATIDSLPFQ
jgi:UPF0271 protein